MALNLQGAKGVATPHLSEDRPADGVPIESARVSIYRSCIMTLLYDRTDRPDLQLEVNELSSFLSAPTEHDWRALIRLGRYLITYPERGIVMYGPVHSEAGVIRLVGRSDTDWAQDKVTRKSRTCLHVLADGCMLSSVVRRQSFIAMS